MSERLDVCLVVMPLYQIARPSIALGLLQGALRGTGIRVATDYANLEFAERVGLDAISLLTYMRTDNLVGEWLFSGVAFPEHTTPAGDILGQVTHYQPLNVPSVAVDETEYPRVFASLREMVPAFVDDVARRILARRPRIVGCSSTFQQHVPSLALLRRLKELDPSVITLLGGANCEAEMGWATIRAFPWVDVVVSGEADELFAPLCRLLLEHGADVPHAVLPEGVLTRAHVDADAFGPGRAPVPRAVIERLDTCPIPDYDDYFAALEASPLRFAVTPGLPVETSRGCWWGETSQCTFCGLNGTGMAYRSKSAERVLAEFDALSRRYGVTEFQVVDNILDLRHVRTVLPVLAKRGAPYRFFYETKSNLRREQVALLTRAGVTSVQPGIEGLHDGLLRLMAKGNSATINVQFLKYAREFGLYSQWLYLVGFPGEDDGWHTEVAEWLPLLAHLQPPNGIVYMRFDRFSVYHTHPDRYGLTLTPYPAYATVYPLEAEILRDLAYFFVDAKRPSSKARLTPGIRELGARVIEWQRAFRREVPAILSLTDGGGTIEILDTRPCAVERRATLTGLAAEVYRACEPAVAERELVRRLGRDGAGRRPEEIRAAIDDLKRRRLLLELHGKCLALAVEGDLPTMRDDFRAGSVMSFDPRTASSIKDAWARLRERLAVAVTG